MDGQGNNSAGKLLRVGLILVGRRSDQLTETKALCERSSGATKIDILTMTTDVTIEVNICQLIDCVRSQFGRVDLLFNNAGINVAPIICGGYRICRLS